MRKKFPQNIYSKTNILKVLFISVPIWNRIKAEPTDLFSQQVPKKYKTTKKKLFQLSDERRFMFIHSQHERATVS